MVQKLCKKLARLREMTGEERHLLCEVFLVVTSTKLILRLLPFQTVRTLLSRYSVGINRAGINSSAGIGWVTLRTPPTEELLCSEEKIHFLLWAIEFISRPLHITCLPCALTLHTLLAKWKVDSDLRIGVSRRAGTLEAHAWVERDGHVLIGGLSNLDHFVPLPILGSAQDKPLERLWM